MQSVDGAHRLRRLQRRQPRADVDRAGLRRSRTIPASCPTPWRAIRRSIRWSRGPSKPACAAARGGRLDWNAGVFRADNHDDILFVADDQTRLRLLQEFRQDAPPGRRSWARAAEFGAIRRSAPATPIWMRPIAAPRPSTATGNSSNDGPAPGSTATIEIEPGDRLFRSSRSRHVQGLCRHWAATHAGHRSNADMQRIDRLGRYARGNENNQHEPDGVLLSRSRQGRRLRGGESGRGLPADGVAEAVRAGQQRVRPQVLHRRAAGRTGFTAPATSSPGRSRGRSSTASGRVAAPRSTRRAPRV